jgi:hypothetical protein
MNKNEFFVSGEELDKTGYGNWMQENDLIKSTATNNRTFQDVDTNIDIKSEYNRSDYDYYRQSSKTPDNPIDIIKTCTKVYKKIGIVRNVIDLMSEFACKGVKLQHPIPSVERFYQKWFEKVMGKDRSERFLNLLYREGNVIVHKLNAKIKKSVEKEWKNVRAALPGDIPMKYEFLSPTNIEVIGGALNSFISKPVYKLRLPANVLKDLKELSKNSTAAQSIHPAILSAIKGGKNLVNLDQENIHVYFYKKDDWQLWAEPMTYAILDDLVTFDKMRLADISALDGAISNIRLWRLGIYNPDNPKNSIMPTKAGINKLRNMLQNNVGGGTMDLVFGPELDFKESSSQVYRFLGSQKYEITLNNIYDGLGIPPTLRSGAKGGNTGSFIALKTLVERLQYGRDVLTQFWNEQVVLVQKAMGFTSPAIVSFDKIILSDESSMFAILLQLADRDYISMDSLLEKFDLAPKIEKSRLYRENKQRGKNLPNKAGPYHNPQWIDRIKEKLILSGKVSPEEIGIDIPNFSPVGNPNDGRPPGVIETEKRKPKPPGKPRTTAELEDVMMWASSSYKIISDILTPAILASYDKSNLRKLTSAQTDNAEHLKFTVLMRIEPFESISEEKVYNILENKELGVNYTDKIQASKERFVKLNSRNPTLEEIRTIYISTYVAEKLYAKS